MSILKPISTRDLEDDKLVRLNWNFDYLAGALAGAQDMIQALSASSSGGSVIITDTPVTSASGPLAAPQSGYLWVVILWPDGSGAPATLWGSSISANSNFDTTNNTFTVFILARSPRKNRWVQAAPQVTGLSV